MPLVLVATYLLGADPPPDGPLVVPITLAMVTPGRHAGAACVSTEIIERRVMASATTATEAAIPAVSNVRSVQCQRLIGGPWRRALSFRSTDHRSPQNGIRPEVPPTAFVQCRMGRT